MDYIGNLKMHYIYIYDLLLFQRWTACALLPDPSTILTVNEYSPCLSSVPTHLLLQDTSVAFTGEWTVQSDVTASSVVHDKMILPLVWDGVEPTHWSDGGVTSSVNRIKMNCKQNNEQQRRFIFTSNNIPVYTNGKVRTISWLTCTLTYV